MGLKDFAGFWRVSPPGAEECEEGSLVAFDLRDPGKVNILCVKDPSFPYEEGTGSYKPDDTIEVTFNGKDYAISLIPGNPPQITFSLKPGQEPGPTAGSWTAEDYVPGSKPVPADE